MFVQRHFLFDIFNSDLLFYSYRILKLKGFRFFDNTLTIRDTSVSSYWFIKVSYLIRNHKFSYTSNRTNFFSNYSLKKNLFVSCFRFKVIELAFLLLLRPLFDPFFVDFWYLTQYVLFTFSKTNFLIKLINYFVF